MRISVGFPFIDALVLVGAEKLVELALDAFVLGEIEVGSLLRTIYAGCGALLVEGSGGGAVHQTFVCFLGCVIVFHVFSKLPHIDKFLVVRRSNVLVRYALFLLIVKKFILTTDNFLSLTHLEVRVQYLSFFAGHFLHAGLQFFTEYLISIARNVHLLAEMFFSVVSFIIFTLQTFCIAGVMCLVKVLIGSA